MALSAHGDWAAVLSGDKKKIVHLWETAKDDDPLTLQGNMNLTSRLAFSPDGKVLAAAASLDRISLWDAATGKPLEGPLCAPKGRDQASNESIRLKGVAPEFSFGLDREDLPSPAAGLVFSPSGKTLVVMSGYQPKPSTGFYQADAGLIRLYDLTTGKERFQMSSQEAVAAFSPDGKTLATGGRPDFAVYVWDAADGRQLARFNGHTGLVTALAYSADGRTLLSGSADGTTLVWEVSGKGP
jgi:WD40 repeat protein